MALPRALFSINGIHQITTASKASSNRGGPCRVLKIRRPPGLAGVIRTSSARMAAVPGRYEISTRSHDALKSGRVGRAQDDPFRRRGNCLSFYEVQKYMNVTKHSWSGYKPAYETGKCGKGCRRDIQAVIERNAQKVRAAANVPGRGPN